MPLQLPVEACPGSVRLHSRVVLQAGITGLPARSITVVLSEPSNGCVLVASLPVPVKVPTSQLTVVNESTAAATDWSFSDDGLCIAKLIRTSTLGPIECCDVLCDELIKVLAREHAGRPPLRFDRQLRDTILHQMSHAVYIIQMDMVAFSTVVETQSGRARLFQAYVQNNHQMLGNTGFTAAQWATLKPQASW